MASVYAGHYGPESVIDDRGNKRAGVSVTVRLLNSATLATLYSSRTRNSASNPTTTDENGNLSFYAEPGFYDLVIDGVVRGNVPVNPDPNETPPIHTGEDAPSSPAVGDLWASP